MEHPKTVGGWNVAGLVRGPSQSLSFRLKPAQPPAQLETPPKVICPVIESLAHTIKVYRGKVPCIRALQTKDPISVYFIAASLDKATVIKINYIFLVWVIYLTVFNDNLSS